MAPSLQTARHKRAVVFLLFVFAFASLVPAAGAQSPDVEILEFAPTDDAYVRPSAPTRNYGADPFLLVDASSRKDFLLRFDVTGLAGRSVVSAALRLFAVNPSPFGGDFYLTTSTDWHEGTVTWANAPAAAEGPSVASLGPVAVGNWYEIDVTSAVPSDGSISLRTISPASDGADYRAKDFNSGSHAPVLVVTVEANPPDLEPPTPPGTLTGSTPTPQQVALQWGAASDNIGVDHYAVSRDGLTIGTTAAEQFSDTTVAIGTTYAYTVVAIDAAGNSSPPSNTVLVETPVIPNTAPTAVADAATTLADTPVTILVLGNDTDPDGSGTPNSDLDPISLTIVDPPSSGQAVPDPATGSITYTPATDFVGDDSFTYQVADGDAALSNVASVAVTVQAGGDTPFVVLAAGDIACVPGSSTTPSACRQAETAALAIGLQPDAVLALGDQQYENGELGNFLASYDPTWGQLKAITYPAPGNHEYGTSGAAGYFGYWGARAGTPATGYYSVDLGGWHIVILNSNCSAAGGCDAASPQAQWLAADLAAAPASCALAIAHHPRFSSGMHGDTGGLQPLWEILADAHVEMFLAAHDHDYERIAPLDRAGNPDTAGVTQFVVGTGGKSLRSVSAVHPQSAVVASTFGLLRLALRADGYDWSFVTESGEATIDNGSATCTTPPTGGPGPNAAPIANDDAAQPPAGTSAHLIPVLNNDTDPDGTGVPNSDLDPTSVTIVSPPASGQTVVDTVTGTITYTPNPGFVGDDLFTYDMADLAGLRSNTATVSLTVAPDAPPLESLTFPVRAAFYYPWFPESWDQGGVSPFTNFTPSAGLYDSSDPGLIATHIDALQYGGIAAGIASWWGQGHPTDARIPELLAGASGGDFRWSLYYEQEGYDDPSVEVIQADLRSIQDRYATHPNFLRVDGRFVVFVWADPQDACGMADRWSQANTADIDAYVVLKTFSGHSTCSAQPASWHQYGPALASASVGTSAFTISPGFWLKGEAAPRLARDLDRWRQDIQAMVASGADWQLVTTFNEWGEGTAVESAAEWASLSGYGEYLDALQNDGAVDPPPNSPPMAVADTATTIPDTPIAVDVLGNDLDSDGAGIPNSDLDLASLTILTPPASGQAVVDSVAGTIVYTPNAGFVGDDAFTYRVSDLAGALSNEATASVSVQPASPPTVLTFSPTDDASIRQSRPGRNYGGAPDLLVDASSKKDFLIRFDIGGLGIATVTRAVIRLFVLDASPAGGQFHAVGAWSENTVTWDTAPPALGTPVATLGAVAVGQRYEVDVTSLVIAGGVVSLRVSSPNSNGADYGSSENPDVSLIPQLVVELQ